MPRLTGRAAVIAAVLCAGALIFATVGVGLRFSGTTFLDPFGSPSSLDYRALRFGSFSPLRGEFIARELGSVIAEHRPAQRIAAPRPAGATSSIRGVTAEPFVAAHNFSNDRFSDAFEVPSIPFTARTNTAGATRQQSEPGGCGSDGGTAWYSYRSPRRIGLLANTFGSAYGTALGVFTGSNPSDLRLVACDSDPSGFAQVAFPAQGGETYWFQIAGPSGGGRLVFNLTLKGVTTMASSAASGEQGDADSILPTISADGRFVSFYSASTNLTNDEVTGPCVPNAYFDLCRPAVFLRDRSAHQVARVDRVEPGGPVLRSATIADGTSITGSVSADGRYVAFWSGHSTLVEGDTNDTWDVFVLDRRTDRVRRVSVSSSGGQSNGASFNPSMSADGRYVAFTSTADNLVPQDTNFAPDVFVHDMRLSTTARVSVSSDATEANLLRSRGYPLESGSHLLSLSANGRYVLFRSTASNLVAGDANGFADVFVRDRLLGKTTRVSVSSEGKEADADSRQPVGVAQGAISNDGRFAFFNSNASNLVPGDTNELEDLFVRDLVAQTTRRVSVSSKGEQADRGVGAQDPFALFITLFTNAVVEPQNLSGVAYSATPDGRYVAFSSDATNLVPGDRNNATDIFLRDLHTGTTTIVSLASTGEQSNGASNSPALSADGRFIAYRSAASNLAAGDNNGQEDVFVYEIPGAHALSGWY